MNKVYSLDPPATDDHTYRVLIESMDQAALTITRDGTIRYSNSQFGRMLGKPLGRIIGTSLQSCFRPEDEGGIQVFIQRKLSRREVHKMECLLPGDTYRVVVLSATRLPPSETKATMCVVVTDITERKRAEKAKDEFISLASHQLRTPATGVKQYLGMLLDGYAGEIDEDVAAFIRTAYNSNEKQLVIINSILRTAQIDSGVYQPTKTPQNLAALIDMVLVDFRPVLQMRDQKLVSRIDEDIEVVVDAAEMTVALANLVENASKYSPNSKTITITASQTAKSINIRVRDQGVGIDAGDQAKIFEKFTRINNPMSDTVNGSGLGLYWVKRIVEMHGGRISVSSTLGKGTTFTVRLPR